MLVPFGGGGGLGREDFGLGGDFFDLGGLGGDFLGGLDLLGLGVLALGGAGLGGAGLGVLRGGHPRVRVPVLIQFFRRVLAGDCLASGPKAVLADAGRDTGLAEQVAAADCVGHEVVGVLVHLPLAADGRAAVALAACLAVGPVAAVALGDQSVDVLDLGEQGGEFVIAEIPQVRGGGDVHIDNLARGVSPRQEECLYSSLQSWTSVR